MKWYYSVKCIAVIQIVFFFKQKTAYEMRISDWSSDVCSSDLRSGKHEAGQQQGKHHAPHGRDQAGHQVSVASIGTGAEVRPATARANGRSEEHTSELQSLMRISYAVFCLKKKKTKQKYQQVSHTPHSVTT